MSHLRPKGGLVEQCLNNDDDCCFTPKYITEFIFPRKLGHLIATRKIILVTLVAMGLYVYINCVDLLIKHVDLSLACCTYWVDVFTEFLCSFR